MEKVVINGFKLDLHIHSNASSHKDGAKVNNNTLENIPLLINKLNHNEVNICSITDHDIFSYDMYATLKQAELQDNSIKKVLPGVEFSVCFSNATLERVIHIVAIFSDEDDSKVQEIETILNENRPTYNGSYKEEDFLCLLRKIEINTILIAHQKNSLTSTKPRKNDANILGQSKFLEFVYTDYFEAFEFKNKRNELLNKNFLFQYDLEQKLRFVTGTDCHDWSAYPCESPGEIIDDFPYTYAKCLPTFKGLVMAITDHTRLKTVNSFFNADKTVLQNIVFKHNGIETTVPLSRGINVIIGDNSIGKSMLLHAITGYSKKGTSLSSKVKSGYKKYLSQLGMDIKPQISPEHIFTFDMQGEVRSKFEENKLNATEFLKDYFPSAINSSLYRNIINSEVERMLDYLTKKFELDSKIKELSTFGIVICEDNAESITFVNNIRRAKHKTDYLLLIIEQIENIILQLKTLEELNVNKEDLAYVNQGILDFSIMKEKYTNNLHNIENENSRMETVDNIIKKISEKHRRNIGDAQKRMSAFAENTTNVKNKIIDILRLRQELNVYIPKIESTKIRPNSNRVYDYEFISKLNIEEINTEYFNSLIERVLKVGKHINWSTITENQLQELLLRYDGTNVIQYFRSVLKNEIESDLTPKNSIIYQGMDKYTEMSSGLDAKIYFDLLSYESQRDGIYMIDQPEDNISQSGIRDYLLDRFKNMSEIRQVIMVSHNPQFIVNLDIDNLIFLSKSNDTLMIQSGALEYVCPEYSILDIVAKNIDGGLDSIRKRWKRYEKADVL